MKQAFIFAALALFLAAPARAGQEVCFDVETNRVMDNGYRVTQLVCAEDGKPLPVSLRIVEKAPEPSTPYIWVLHEDDAGRSWFTMEPAR